ncbi:uncharacterized protein BDR25DRAFT_27386 [Lindgomyces ingoldianus]|uniref:Uncharacterized protein n=1 Tax=Lindgomyces ingoldianus TaxID=673940 RepID=A0ACB6QWM4_9PLEO|nr:uncharacterized protein BDR25DRAFT_27386 [Lindgomyces ingoldianus]KAF2471454.1 hypothetical protein BDR25DRAFT_27386 [Lindgomyces ingoldianus]
MMRLRKTIYKVPHNGPLPVSLFALCASLEDVLNEDIFGSVSFLKRDRGVGNDTSNELDSNRTLLRQTWKVGIAYNTFRIVDHPRIVVARLREMLAHWGLYICLVDETRQNSSCQIFGLNFVDDDVGSLILEDVWGTERGWFRKLNFGDFERYQGYPEIEMHFALEEFIFEAQMFLRSATEFTGGKYNLLFMNCQHFAAHFFAHLQNHNWCDSRRLDADFQLEDMARRIKCASLAPLWRNTCFTCHL